MPNGNQSLYHDDIRRSYDQLLDIAKSLDALAPHPEEGIYLQKLGETMARFVEQIVWADQRVAPSEVQAIDTLIAADSAEGGSLGDCLRNPCGDLTELSTLPEFLRECVRQDLVHHSSLGPTAVDAFESLGIALMASDRDIAADEIGLLQTVLGAWRTEMQK